MALAKNTKTELPVSMTCTEFSWHGIYFCGYDFTLIDIYIYVNISDLTYLIKVQYCSLQRKRSLLKLWPGGSTWKKRQHAMGKSTVKIHI